MPGPTAPPLRQVFAGAVDELCADAAVIGIALSGGVASLAVLVHVLSLRSCRRLVAFVVDLIDDDGNSAVSVVHRVLADLACGDLIQVVPVTVPADGAGPRWSPYGPRLEAMPTAAAAVAELAVNAGVDLLLTGDGADELLAVPRFATGSVLRQSGLRAAGRYAHDMARFGSGMADELLSMVSSAVPRPLRAWLYWAAAWADWSPPAVSPVLGCPYREQALAWARQWVDDTVRAHNTAGRSWASANAFDAWWPRNYRPPAGTVPEASPFLHPDVVAAALSLPVASRYDSKYGSPYLRSKAQVVKLFPPVLRSALPQHKRRFRRALETVASGTGNAPFATGIGFLDPHAITREPDIATRLMVDAVEQWLTGAVAAGVIVP